MGENFDHHLFRANPELELVPICDVTPAQRSHAGIVDGGAIFAALRSSVTTEFTALLNYEATRLFLSLSAPQKAGSLLANLTGMRRRQILSRMVCDQMLQVRHPDDTYRDGILASEILFDDEARSGNRTVVDRLDRLSGLALSYVAALNTDSGIALINRLYGFNAMPRTTDWEQIFDAPSRISHWLGITSDKEWVGAANRRYVMHGSTTGETHWIRWVRNDLAASASLHYKLYVSPIPEQLPEVIPIVADVCCALDIPAFKVGATLTDVLRSDKLVIYVSDEASLWRLAEELSFVMKPFTPHGVPFTKSVDEGGLLSWAIDPIVNHVFRYHDKLLSWRMHIAETLGHAIARARGMGQCSEIIDFALHRLRLNGIDPLHWSMEDKVNENDFAGIQYCTCIKS